MRKHTNDDNLLSVILKKVDKLPMTFFFTTLFILLFILLSIVVFSLKNGISPMPTTGRVRRALFDVLPNIDQGVIADLGSGWGNLIFPLASKYRTSEVIGFENSWIPFWFSYFLNGCSNNLALGNVINALSHDLTVTVCKPTSTQSPSIFKEGIVTQSPSLIVSEPKI